MKFNFTNDSLIRLFNLTAKYPANFFSFYMHEFENSRNKKWYCFEYNINNIKIL